MFSMSAMDEETILLDHHSQLILAELQRDARLTVQQISDAVGLSATARWKRIKEMESLGVITGYTALVDRKKIGLKLAVVDEVNLSRHSEVLVQAFEQAVATSPQIVRRLSTTGQSDYIMTVLLADIKVYERFLHDTIFKLPGVTHVRSSIVLEEIKAQTALPVAPSANAARGSRSAAGRTTGAGRKL